MVDGNVMSSFVSGTGQMFISSRVRASHFSGVI